MRHTLRTVVFGVTRGCQGVTLTIGTTPKMAAICLTCRLRDRPCIAEQRLVDIMQIIFCRHEEHNTLWVTRAWNWKPYGLAEPALVTGRRINTSL